MLLSVTIRAMTDRDLVWAASLAAQLSTAPRWSTESWQASLAAASLGKALALVAEVERSPAAFAVVSLLPPAAELESIAVAPARQRQGLASQLLMHVMKLLRQQQFAELTLEVRATNVSALGLYARAGFVPHGRRRNYYTAPADDALILRHSL